MKATPWTTYRTRFLVQAKQLTTSLTFTDALGRQHSGRKGDYLVESSDGVLRIAPRQIFEDIYVPLHTDSKSAHSKKKSAQSSLPQSSLPPDKKPWRLTLNHPQLDSQAHPPRKSPQPDRIRRNGIAGTTSH
jgi:hypothetical protein